MNPTENYSNRVPLSPDEPKTLIELFLRASRIHNKQNALNYKREGTWHAISAGEMLARIRNIAAGLYSLGLRKGDRAAIISESCPEWTLADGGCLFAGVIDVPIYPTLTPQQVCYITKDSGSRVVFVSSKANYEKFREELGSCSSLERVIFFDGRDVSEQDGLTLAQVEQRGRELREMEPSLLDNLATDIHPDDLATIIYTSGTTGEPKGVMLSHANFTINVIDSSGHLTLGANDVALSVLPLSHVFERLAMYMYIHHGMSVYYAESLEKVGDNFREVHPTIFVGVPRLFEKIYARMQEKAAAEGKATAAILAWAVSVGKAYAKRALN